MSAAAAASRWPAPSADDAPGSGMAILVNPNAKRGGRRVAVQIARTLPGASVRLTKSTHEIAAWLRVLPALRGVFAAGGDGTAVALVNAMAAVTPQERPPPTMGVLPFGTRHRWAHSPAPPKPPPSLQLSSRTLGTPPRR